MIRFALGLYDQILRMLHPIVPFVTEEIWQNLTARADGESISTSPFPQADISLVSPQIEREYSLMQETVEAIRRMRSSANVPPSKAVAVTLKPADAEQLAVLDRAAPLMGRLARVEPLAIALDVTKPGLSATEVVRGVEVHVDLEGLIDVEKERQKTEKEIGRLEGQVRAIEGKLSNEKFVANAPEDVVAREREKLQDYRETIGKLRETLKSFAP
jgi:valyl-tRNA synthetase